MERERRKRPANGSDGGRRARPREEDEGLAQAATDGEVEEFFAILRRMHAAGKHFRHANGSGFEITDRGARWRPVFQWEDFAGLNAAKSNGESVTAGGREGGDRKRRDETAEQTGGLRCHGTLDLNAEPEPEHSAHSSG